MNHTRLDTACIRRDKHSKQAHIELTIDGDWAIYTAERTGTAALPDATPLLRGTGSGIFALPLPPRHQIVFLEAGGRRRMLAERLLPMSGGWNFRDLGGLPGKDGKRLLWGRLFRSDDMQNLTECDLEYLASIPLATVVDFRTDYEVKLGPDKLPATVSTHFRCPIEPGKIAPELLVSKPTQKQAQEIMKAVYRALVTEDTLIGLYRDFFALVQEERRLPLLFHCSAGKDRTGLAAALILLALGVDESVIMHDYMQSATHLDGKYDGDSPLYTVLPAYLEAALEQMYSSYGSPQNYLTERLNVDLEKMRALFLDNG